MRKLTIDQFLAVKNKTIICFGAGSYFKIMYYDIKMRKSDFKVVGVIDNNPDKVGEKITILGDIIPILSLKNVIEQYQAEDILIFITTTFYQAVLDQLLQNNFFKNVDIVSYYELMRRETPEYTYLETSLAQPMIPKIIHYCWFGDKQMPDHLQRQVQNWHRLCPDYEFICWNEKNYDVNKNKYTKDAYEKKKWAYLPDYVRLDVVYQYGGIYMDTDVELVQSLDKLRCNEAFFGTEIAGGINEGSGFGAVREHYLVRELMEVYEKLDGDNPLGLTASSGKEIEVFHKHGFINNGRYQLLNGVAIYPYQVLTAMIRETGECMKTDATVAIHHFEGSWC